MSKAEVTGLSISVEFGFEQEFGKGTKSFANIQSKYPEPAQLENLNEVVFDGLDMYFTVWQTVLSSRYATGVLGGTEYKDTLSKATDRIEKVRTYLKTLGKNGKSK